MTFGLLPSGPVPEPGLTHATDHKERAIGVLLSELRDKPRFTKLIEILIKPFQELEDVFWSLYTRRLDTAQGVQLDVFGHIVKEPRSGLGDDDYLAIIRIKIKVLRSTGTPEELITIVRLFLQSDNFTYEEFYPAAIEVVVFEDVALIPRLQLLKKFLRQAKPGGVRIDVINASGGTPERFHYAAPGTLLGSGAGYGSGSYGGLV